MSRFSQLEFGSERGDGGAERRDEGYYLGKAREALARGDFERALRGYARVLEENPGSEGGWSGQVRMLLELGRAEEARAWADKGLERLPGSGEMAGAKAAALARLGDLEAALVYSDRAIEAAGESPWVWVSRAEVLLTCARGGADYSMDRAMELGRGDWMVAWLAARVRVHHGQWAAALRTLQQAVMWDAGRAVVWLERGECERELGYETAARQSFEQALALDSDCEGARQGMLELRQSGWWGRWMANWRRIFRG